MKKILLVAIISPILMILSISLGKAEINCNSSLKDNDGYSYFEMTNTNKRASSKGKAHYGYTNKSCRDIKNKQTSFAKKFTYYKQISKQAYCRPNIFSEKDYGDALWLNYLSHGNSRCDENNTKLASSKVPQTPIIKDTLSSSNNIYTIKKDDWTFFCNVFGSYEYDSEIDGCSQQFIQNYKQYYFAGDFKAWAATKDIKSSILNGDHYGVTWNQSNLNAAKKEALAMCEKNNKKTTDECVIIAEGDNIVDKKTVEVIASINSVKENSNILVAQEQNILDDKSDTTAPILKLKDQFNVNESEYSISGEVIDDSKVYVQIDGNIIPSKNGKFIIKGYIPLDEKQQLSVVAVDQWGNKSEKNIVIERSLNIEENQDYFEVLDPVKVKTKQRKNRIALVIGIEKYINISNAKYAKRDAQYFIDYAQNSLGIPFKNIRYFFDEDADFKAKFEIKRWLKKNVRKNSEVFIYFSGHGIAQNDGQELYLLANDTIADFIDQTSINRNEIFNDIAQYNPKSVTAFLDTCYSGAGRADGEMLLAMAKGLVVVDEQQQQLPDNFTLFTAASAQESAWSLPEAKHGTFSYFLMKGMEGAADLNDDKKLTNGELQEYLLDNVGRFAQQQQTPQMIGDPNQVLVRF